MTELCWAMFICAAAPFFLCCWNLFYFRSPRAFPGRVTPVSVLIPARNEGKSIAECLAHVLASLGVELDVVVLNDHSTDDTAEIVQAVAALDDRVRLVDSQPLPEDWCGKQFACFQLSKLAKHDRMVFMDADVWLDPIGLGMLIAFQERQDVPLVSAFPKQIAGTWLEKLVIPMIHFLLLGFLPMWGMRHFLMVGFGAGCGQLFLARRDTYERIGGHELVKSSMHDGVKLPQAYRRAGYMTDLCDGRQMAECRMYRNARQVWNGFAKNAREGIAKPPLIFFFTAVLILGQVLPSKMIFAYEHLSDEQFNLVLGALSLSLTMRLLLGGIHLSAWEAIFHPIGVLAFLAIQWYANLRHWIGKPIGWKGRTMSESFSEPSM